MATPKTLARVQELIARFQTRLDSYSSCLEVVVSAFKAHDTKIAQLTEEANRAYTLNGSRALVAQKANEELAAKMDRQFRELTSTTQKALDNVAIDMRRSLEAIQRLNERVSKLEGQKGPDPQFEQRLAVVERDLRKVNILREVVRDYLGGTL